MAGSVDDRRLAAAIRAGDRAALPRAITLVESTRADHREQAQQLLLELMPRRRAARMHVGITGVPGVGKSTTIEALGMYLIEQGHRVAVLAVDPSSTRTGGSILGDKTRMARLAVHPDAYIRPSPTSGTLGGVARATRETIVLLEAAGFDVILVETVGVGQSEVTVANMVDTFVFLTLARTGDQLQGIKKGVLELADIVVVNKADGEHADRGQGGRPRAVGRDAADLSARHAVAATGSDDERAGGHGSGRVVGHRARAPRGAHRRGGVRRPPPRPAGGLDVVDGPRHRARPGAVQSRGAQDPRRGRTSGPRRRADPGAGGTADPRCGGFVTERLLSDEAAPLTCDA